MIWCWQQDPEMRPTATQVVEVAKSEQFCRLVNGIHIDNSARVLCACQREIIVTLQTKSKTYKKRNVSSGCFEISTSYKDTKDFFNSLQLSTEKVPIPSARSVSEGHFVYDETTGDAISSLKCEDSDTVSPNSNTLPKKLDVVHKYELWVSSSDVHSSRITIVDYFGKFTGIQV